LSFLTQNPENLGRSITKPFCPALRKALMEIAYSLISMKVLVVGCGNIGSVAAKDLAKSMKSLEIVVADNNEARAKAVAEDIGTDNVSSIRLDVADQHTLLDTLRGYTLVMGFLPGNLGYRLAETCVKAGKDMVDVSYMAENPLLLDNKAAKAGVTVVPDCGLAPGISNLLVGHAAASLNEVRTVRIMVGGLPEKPLPPLGYVITWSAESLIDEYTRKAGIIRKGRKTEVEALSELEEIEFPGVGKLEAFYTDGLRTLMYTIDKPDEMWEKTLRYPGHAERIKMLRALGFFDESPVSVNGTRISPRKLTATLLTQKLQRPENKDIVALRVEVSGIEKCKKTKYRYHLLDFYDEKHNVTAMARTTAYPASIAARLLLGKAIKDKGLVPVEKIGMHNELFRTFIDELEKRNVKVTEEKSVG